MGNERRRKLVVPIHINGEGVYEHEIGSLGDVVFCDDAFDDAEGFVAHPIVDWIDASEWFVNDASVIFLL